MKKILSLLTLALLGAAATAFGQDETTTTAAASPSNYYYDYYLNPPKTDVLTNAPGSSYYEGHNDSDTVTYGTRDNQGNVIENPNVFTVARESNWGNSITGANKNNFYRVEFGSFEYDSDQKSLVKTANSGAVTLYLTDYVSEVVPQSNDNFLYNSTPNALFNMGIEEYGYRVLTTTDGKTYTAGETFFKNIYAVDDNGNFITDDGGNRILSSNVTPIDSVDYYDDGRTKVRYKYELGTFDPDKIIEVYMKDADGREVYSFSSYELNADTNKYEYTPFDKTTINGNGGAMGGFTDGDRVAGIETDKMLSLYYFSEKLDNGTRDNPDYKEESLEKFDSAKDIKVASEKAMPLAFLKPGNSISNLGVGTQVAFGFYGVAVGSPLPGGVQIALIAGLFGLGFCYARRRKAIIG